MRLIAVTGAAGLLCALALVAPLAGPAAASAGQDHLSPGQALRPGQSLVSADRAQRLTLDANGQLALFGSASDAPRWVADTTGPAQKLVVTRTGDVELVGARGARVWSTSTSGHPTASLVLGTDGDLVVQDARGTTLWDAGTAVTPSTLAPRGVLRAGDMLASPDGRQTLVVQAGGSVDLLAVDGSVRWSTGTSTPGSRLVLRSDGNLLVLAPNGAALWSAGTAGHPGATLAAQDDGQVVLKASDGSVVWTTGTAFGPSTLADGHALPAPAGLTSLDGQLQLRLADQKLALTYDGQEVWSVPIALPSGGALVVREDVGIGLVGPDGSTLWSTDLTAGPGAVLSLEGTSAVLRTASGQALWQQDVPPQVVAAAQVPALTQVTADCSQVTGPVSLSATLVTTAGARVDRCLAGAVDALVAAAARSGVALRASGWRSSAEQAALRAAHCVAGSGGGAVCWPPTAPVGQSMHERGLALDFTQGGTVLTQQSTGFVWLTQHAAAYGLKNLPSEPWHWSTNGS